MEWQVIETAPFDRDLELAVVDADRIHALVFPCRRVPDGWRKSDGKTWVEVHPTHWREWSKSN
jgi:hypothetical protein